MPNHQLPPVEWDHCGTASTAEKFNLCGIIRSLLDSLLGQAHNRVLPAIIEDIYLPRYQTTSESFRKFFMDCRIYIQLT